MNRLDHDNDLDTDLLAELLQAEDKLSSDAIEEIPEGSHFLLTDIQRGYLMGRNPALPLGGAACQFYHERVCDTLDITRFNSALTAIVKRHSMLRIDILSPEEQTIRPMPVSLHTPIHDLSCMSEKTAEEQLLETRQRLSRALPAADKWPLFDLEYTRMPSGKTHIHLRFDQLNTDQQSILILLQETALLYQQPDHKLQPIALSFSQYLSLAKPSPDMLNRAQTHWQERAKILPPAPILPITADIENAGVPEYQRLSTKIPRNHWLALQTIARNAEVTISCLLLECFGQILRRWCESSHFTINMTLFNREPLHADVPKIVGDFTTTMLFDLDMHANQNSRADHLSSMQKSLWRDLEFKAISGIEVMAMMAQAQGHLDRPLMPVVFTSTLSQEATSMMNATQALPGEIVTSLSQTPQVILDNQVMEDQGELAIHWDIATNILPLQLAETLFKDYQNELETLINSPDVLYKPTQYKDPSERDFSPILAQQSALLRLSDLWLENLSASASCPAIFQGDESYSHQMLAEQVAGLLEGLNERNVKIGDKIALIFNKSMKQIAATLACSIHGSTFVPIDSTQPASRQIRILQDLDPILIMHSEADPSVLTEHQSWDISQSERINADILHQTSGAAPEDLAYILYTSGSTGTPKGVMITHEAALNTVLDINQRFNITSADRVLAVSELHFDLSIQDIFGTLGCGGALVLPGISGKQDPSHWSQLCNSHNVTVWNTVPGLFELYLDYLETNQKKPQHHLKNIMLSGDWIGLTLPPRSKNYWPEVSFYSLGGATEASIWSIYFEVNEASAEWQSIPYGKGLGGQQVFVLTQDLEVAPPGRIGDLYIAGKGLATGYFNDLEKTKGAFFNHPRSGLPLYRTGDLGAYDRDGMIVFHGRADGQLKINGFRLEIGEVSEALTHLNGVQDCRVLAKGEGTRKSLAAFIKSDGEDLDLDALRDDLAASLPHYMIPDSWHQIDQLPLTANGKVDNKALLALTKSQENTNAAVFNADDTLSEQVCQMVAEVLKCPHVTPHDNLITLGAGSLELIALANRIQAFTSKRPQLTALARAVALPDLISLVAELLPSSGNKKTGESIWPGEAQVQDYLKKTPVISDPLERRLFKSRLITKDDSHAVTLPETETVPDASRRSTREFSRHLVSTAAISHMLNALRVYWTDNAAYRSYASSGGLYPVQTYLLAYQIDELANGAYLYDPQTHRLLPRGNTDLPTLETLSSSNAKWIGKAHFMLNFVLDLSAIAPLYEGASLPFGLMETGAMGQLIDNYALQAGIGTCHIGDLPPSRISALCALQDHQVFLHGLVGGALTEEMLKQRQVSNAAFNIELTEETL